MECGDADRPGVAYRRPDRSAGTVVFESAGAASVFGGEQPPGPSDPGSYLDVVDERDRETLREALRDGDDVDVSYRVGGGDEPRWVRERGRVVDGDVVGYLFDDTERAERREDLERAESMLDSIFEHIPVHLYVKDANARHLRVSEDTHSEIEGNLVGKRDIDIDNVDEAHRRAAYEDDLRVIETGEPVIDKEEYIEAFDKWNLTSKVPWRRDGEVRGLIGISWDVSDRVAYREEVERQRERLEEFASVVSHDLRNPLNVAAGRVDLARERLPDEGAAAVEDLDRAETALDRMEALVTDLLTLARQGETIEEGDAVDVAATARDAWANVDGDGRLAVDPVGVTVGDRSRLQQLFENLFRNAVEHGTANDRAEPGDGSDPAGSGVSLRVGPIVEHGEHVGFFVADDGPGIPPSEREQVLEAGFTTDPTGTGFGLSIVTRVVDAHGWSLSVTESTDGGARFEVRDVSLETPDAPAEDGHPC